MGLRRRTPHMRYDMRNEAAKYRNASPQLPSAKHGEEEEASSDEHISGDHYSSGSPRDYIDQHTLVIKPISAVRHKVRDGKHQWRPS